MKYFGRTQRGVIYAGERSTVGSEIIVRLAALILLIARVYNWNWKRSPRRLWRSLNRRLWLFLRTKRPDLQYEDQWKEDGYENRFVRSHRHVSALRDHDDIAGQERNILLREFSLNDILVVEWMLHLFAVLGSKNVDVLQLGKLCETTRTGKCL